jgi:hypothetical protein
MPWCPKCGAEYEPGFTVCSDCDAVLEAHPPQSVDLSDYTDMVQVATLENEVEGSILSGILTEEGIHSFVRSWAIGGYDSISEAGTSSWGELLVMETDFDSAKFIITEYLNSLESGHLPDESNEETPEDGTENPPE